MARRRRRAGIALVALAALLALAALRVVAGKSLGGWVRERERARFEREVGALDPGLLAAPALADAENAVPAIRAALVALRLDARDHDLLQRADESTLTAGERAAIDALLGAHRAEIAALARAAALPRSSFGARDELFHGEALDALAWMRAAGLVAADGERARAGADAPRLEAALATLHGLAVAARREPLAIFAILGTALESRYLDLLQKSLAEPREARFLARSAEQLATLRALPGPFAVTHGEAVFGFAMLRTLAAAPPRAPADLGERLEAWLWPWSEGHVEAGQLAGWRQLSALARLPQARWPSDREIAEARHGALRRWLDPTVPLDTVRRTLLPNLLAVVRRLQLLQSGEQLAQIAVGLATRAQVVGAYPESLDGLPGAAQPDAASGAPPSYRRLAGGAAALVLPFARELATPELAGRRARAGHPGPARVAARRARLLSWRLPAPRAPEPAASR